MRRAASRALLLALLLALLVAASGANYAKARPACCLRIPTRFAALRPALTRPARGRSTARSATARTRAGEASSTPWCDPATRLKQSAALSAEPRVAPALSATFAQDSAVLAKRKECDASVRACVRRSCRGGSGRAPPALTRFRAAVRAGRAWRRPLTPRTVPCGACARSALAAGCLWALRALNEAAQRRSCVSAPCYDKLYGSDPVRSRARRVVTLQKR